MMKSYLIQKSYKKFFEKGFCIILYSYRIFINDNNFKLSIKNVSLNDRGRYQCQAENLAGRSQQIFDVQVYSKY